jgi:hypothetical protein
MKKTWMHGDVHWLKDEIMLQKFVPEARISVYGYRSQWMGPDAVQEARISSIADDLLHQIYLDREGVSINTPGVSKQKQLLTSITEKQQAADNLHRTQSRWSSCSKGTFYLHIDLLTSLLTPNRQSRRPSDDQRITLAFSVASPPVCFWEPPSEDQMLKSSPFSLAWLATSSALQSTPISSSH